MGAERSFAVPPIISVPFFFFKNTSNVDSHSVGLFNPNPNPETVYILLNSFRIDARCITVSVAVDHCAANSNIYVHSCLHCKYISDVSSGTVSKTE